jgi:mannitol-specific phosphotransferase system IIBC component
MVELEIIAFLSPIVSALIIWYIQHRHMEHDKKRDELQLVEKRRQEEKEKEKEAESNARAEARKQENLLTMRMIKAIGKLSYANSVAIKEGKVNGVMEEALVYYRDASDEMTKFLQEQAVGHYVK